MKKIPRKTRELKVRIVFVELKTEEIETLFTNLPKEIATLEELKQLYRTKWTIEKNYNRLKKKLHMEKFPEKKKNNRTSLTVIYTNSTKTRHIIRNNKKPKRNKI